MNLGEVIDQAKTYLAQLPGKEFDVLEIAKPVTPEIAVNLAKIVSKLSPFVGNLIEFNTCEYLNEQDEFAQGTWVRQDPGFPDAVFVCGLDPKPGFEIKAWLPLATEMTGRFKDSQRAFSANNTYVAVVAWLPEHLIYGKPHIVAIDFFDGLSVAKARDDHYHNPPDYIVIEPGDTSSRTINLQQTNTAGYKFQGIKAELREATTLVESWGPRGRRYSTTPTYQKRLKQLIGRYGYRLDTNFAKMDRIVHPGIERFKASVHKMQFHGLAIGEWQKLLSSGNDDAIRAALDTHVDIRTDNESVVE